MTPPPMSDAKLLAVVEVSYDDRVRCQAAGCGHPVYRRIHVVQDETGIHVYGSECFKKLFLGMPVATSMPTYTSADGRKLTDAERQMLVENTERLIQQLQAEHEEAQAARRAAIASTRSTQLPPPRRLTDSPKAIVPLDIEAQAKANIRTKYNVDPDLPGWRGLLLDEIKRLRS